MFATPGNISGELNGISSFKLFRGKTLDVITEKLSAVLCNRYRDNVGNVFLSLIGEGKYSNHTDRYDGCISSQMNFVKSRIYEILSNESDYKSYAYYLKCLLALEISEAHKSVLINGIDEAISFSNIPIVLIEDNNQYYFLPKGAEELNTALLTYNLNWLSKYPDVKRIFLGALEKYEYNSFERNLLDDLRLSVETLLKSILNNNKSLENQTSDVGIFLKSKGVSSEVASMYWKLLDYFSKYQNSYVKHNDNVNTHEVELIIYLTGVFIRFLSKI